MRSISILLLLAPAAVSCSSEEANPDEVVYLDASAAVDAGHAAWTAGAYTEAASAYSAARQMLGEPSPMVRDLVFRECLALVGADRDGDAIDTLVAYVEQAPETLDAASLRGLIDACLQKGPTTSTGLAEFGVRVAREALAPEEQAQFDFEHVELALTALQSGDLSTLAGLGYVDTDAVRPKPKSKPKPAQPAKGNEEDLGL